MYDKIHYKLKKKKKKKSGQRLRQEGRSAEGSNGGFTLNKTVGIIFKQ